jgi:hypothetical protein
VSLLHRARVRRIAVAVHRWLGVGLCGLFLLWFASGLGMLVWDFPGVTSGDRLARSPAVDASTVAVSMADAHARLGSTMPVARVRLGVFDRRPVYRFDIAGRERVVYADTGEPQSGISTAALARVASAWTGRPPGLAVAERIDVDQWTVEGTFRELAPLWKYSWPTGEQVYVSQTTGEVVQYTTAASRIGAYFGPIPHWLFFTPLRRHPTMWTAVVVAASGAGAFSAVLGILIAVTVFSPAKRYRAGGAPAAIPYRGPKRWHVALGLVFGAAAATWAFSGMLSMDPFATGSASRIPESLLGGCDLESATARDVRTALVLAGGTVVQLECASLAGEPLYLATLTGGATRIVPIGGAVRSEFSANAIAASAAGWSPGSRVAGVIVVTKYDRYYLDRHRRRPLPVLLVRLDDADGTRLYVDPKTASVAGSYSSRQWTARWLYHGLHSLDFPWLYETRPSWDLIVVGFMLGGAALSVTAIVLSWKVVTGRRS